MAQRAEAELRAILADIRGFLSDTDTDRHNNTERLQSGAAAAAERGGAGADAGAEPLHAALIHIDHMHDPKRCVESAMPCCCPLSQSIDDFLASIDN